MSQTNLIYIGVAGTVIALDRASGEEVWRTKLKGSEFVNVALQGGDLFATANGELFCLDPANGTMRWRNKLTGMGYGLITISASGGQQIVMMQEKKQCDESAANSST